LKLGTLYLLYIKSENDSGPFIKTYFITTQPLLSVTDDSNSISITITNKEDNVLYEYSIDNVQYIPITLDEYNQFTITDGINSNTSYIINVKGIIGLEDAITSINVKTKPAIPILSVAPASNSILVGIGNKEDNVTYAYSIDNVNYTDVTLDENNHFTITDGIISDTEYNVTVKAMNEPEQSVITGPYNVKTTISSLTPIILLSVSTDSTSITVTINNKDDNFIYTYSINNVNYIDVTLDENNQFTITDGIISDTEYNLTIKARTVSGIQVATISNTVKTKK